MAMHKMNRNPNGPFISGRLIDAKEGFAMENDSTDKEQQPRTLANGGKVSQVPHSPSTDKIIANLETLCPNHGEPFEVCSSGGRWSVQCIAHDAIDEINRLLAEYKQLHTKYAQCQAQLLDWR